MKIFYFEEDLIASKFTAMYKLVGCILKEPSQYSNYLYVKYLGEFYY